MRKLTLLMLITGLCLAGCNVIEKSGNRFGKGLNANTTELVENALTGVQNKMNDTLFRRDLQLFMDSVIMQAGLSTNRAALALRDSLLNDRWIAFTRQLVDAATGAQARANAAALRDELLGPTTRRQIQTILEESLQNSSVRFASLRDDLLGEKTRSAVGILRDDLLGYKTNLAVRAIVDSVMVTMATRLRTEVNGTINENTPFIKRHAERLLAAVGVLALLIIFLTWHSRQKYLKMVSVITSQIHSIPDENAYDELTARIKNAALITNVEKDLNDFLKQNQIAGKDDWEQTRKKMTAGRSGKSK